MSYVNELLKQGRKQELWELCCGFIDLSLEQFMAIQKRLLLEQIDILKNCRLGRKVMRGAMPETVEEFRRDVPLTTYNAYCPELLDKSEASLPDKPAFWVQTAGRSGEYECKYIPIPVRYWEEAWLVFGAITLFATASKRGDFTFKDDFKMLCGMGPAPYLTGYIARAAEEILGFHYLPSLIASEEMSLEERSETGLKMALSTGLDGFFGLAGILVAIGEKFRQRSGSSGGSGAEILTHPKATLRLAKGLMRSRLAGRPMLPKDLWSPKLICTMGTDSQDYKRKVEEYWGKIPFNVYGNSETVLIATQTWDHDSMVFFPNLNFLEFIPEEESTRSFMDQSYQPQTILLDEVKAGKNYELVVSNFHGGALVRYRIGDIIRITGLRNEKLGIELPQMVFERRAQDFIDLEFMRLTEKTIQQALVNTGIPYREWTAQKEKGDTPKLHIIMELQDNHIHQDDIAMAIYEELKRIDHGFHVYKEISSLENLIDFRPIEVTLVPPGTFANYEKARKSNNLASRLPKISHVNPAEESVALLTTSSFS